MLPQTLRINADIQKQRKSLKITRHTAKSRNAPISEIRLQQAREKHLIVSLAKRKGCKSKEYQKFKEVEKAFAYQRIGKTAVKH
jgi:hypothetical protein